MNSFLGALWERTLWAVNGFLIIVYYTTDHLLTLALLISLAAFVWVSPAEQRGWAAGMGFLALVASLSAPAPVPLFLLTMSLAGWFALYLEKYNQPAQRWNVIRGVSLYALAGLGFALYRELGLGEAVSADPQMAQGAVYLNALVGISMYIIPLGFLAVLAQSIWAHPPAPGAPADMIGKVRSRGRD